MAVNDDILDAQLSHAIGLRRYEVATNRKIIKLLSVVDKRLADQIRKRNPGDISFTSRRLNLLLDAIRKINVEAYSVAMSHLVEDIRELAVYEGAYQADLLKKTIPVRLDIITPTASQLIAAVNSRPFQGKHLKDYVKDLPRATTEALRNAVRNGYVEGRTTEQIVRDIRGTRALNYKDGILERTRRSVTMLARTALNHTANTAREELYRQNARVIKKIRWVSTLDSRTSDVCISRDGKLFDVGRGPRPPAHPNCRSTTTPVTRSARDMGIDLKEVPAGTRASMNGQVPADVTYGQWLKKQPVGFQDDVLGKTKGQLFRKGGMSVDKFVDRKGASYTLDQLRKRDAGAFEKAGL